LRVKQQVRTVNMKIYINLLMYKKHIKTHKKEQTTVKKNI